MRFCVEACLFRFSRRRSCRVCLRRCTAERGGRWWKLPALRTWVARCAEPCSLFGGGQREHGHLSCAAAWAAAPSFVLVQSWPFFFLLAVAGLSSVGGCGFSLSVHQAPNGSWAPRIGSMLSVFLFCSFFKYIYIYMFKVLFSHRFEHVDVWGCGRAAESRPSPGRGPPRLGLGHLQLPKAGDFFWILPEDLIRFL